MDCWIKAPLSSYARPQLLRLSTAQRSPHNVTAFLFVSGFVAGKKLRMTGGAEEVERVRQRRNELTLKAMFTGGSSGPGSASSSAAPSPGLPMSPSGASSPASFGDED